MSLEWYGLVKPYPEWYDGNRTSFEYPHWEFATESMGMGEGWWTTIGQRVVFLHTSGSDFIEAMWRPAYPEESGDWTYMQTYDMDVDQVKAEILNLMMEDML